MAVLDRLLVRLGVDSSDVERGIERAQNLFGRLSDSIDRISGPAKFAALAGSANHMVAALAPAAGALAALPAAVAGAQVAMKTLNLALTDVSDTLGSAIAGDTKKFNEALKSMPPAARSVVGEMGTALADLQDTAQQAFFKPMVKQAKGLGKQLRGPLRSGVADVAKAWGGMGSEILGVVRSAKSLKTLKDLFAGVADFLDGASKGVAPLLKGVRDLVGAFTGGFGKAGDTVGGLMAKLGTWLSGIANSGQAVQWVKDALATFRQLGTIVKNLAVGLGGVFGAANADGTSLLTTLTQLSAKFAAWANSAEGQKTLANIFNLINQTAQALTVILPVVGGALTTIANLIAMLPAPAQDAIAGFLAFSLVAGVITSRIGPLASGIGKVAGVAKKLKGPLATAGKGLLKFGAMLGRSAAKAATWAGRVAVSAARAAASMAAATARMVASTVAATARIIARWALMGAKSLLHAAKVAAAWVMAMGPIGWIIAAVIALVALIIANWDKIKSAIAAAWNWIKSKTVAIWNAVKNFIKENFVKILAVILGPLGLIVGLVIKNWDKIKAFTAAAWNWIKEKISSIWNAIKTAITTVVNKVKSFITGAFNKIQQINQKAWNAFKNVISTAWNRIKSAVTGHINKMIGIVRRIPGRITGAIGNLGRLLFGAGKRIVQGLIDGIKNMFGKLGSVASSMASKVRDVLPFSPAKTGPLSGSGSPQIAGGKIASMLASGMSGGRRRVAAAASGLAGAASGLAADVGPGAFATPAGVRAAAAAGDRDIVIRSDGSRMGDLLVEVLREAIRNKNGGDVQGALGRGNR